LRDQLRRAALSVSNNVAEGFERGTTAELLMFLYIARGSAGEVRSMLRFCERLVRPEISNLKSEISDLNSEFAALTRCRVLLSTIRGWADSLQNSDIQGQRHLNKNRAERSSAAEAFRQLIDQKPAPRIRNCSR
jgi:four helix bundle protein